MWGGQNGGEMPLMKIVAVVPEQSVIRSCSGKGF
jgi:hypothetical protein